ncbi:hypothetical protein DES39_2143 [Orbus hercynius]|uniref:Uncharacterized protein n=1 Tax=Orbus hercynius TaxID=593135 RepID=A0A495RAE9_9GAMM|nr:hypothetical protein [Orbus hercynius]RKS84467.1 hypothetical protein DES39_2143 [Orbus hercynius]
MSQNQMPNPKVDIERVNEIKKASFWVSQVFILLATVIGVYLAASQGYKQAVQFENMTSYKESYYLQKSLQYELQDNIVLLKGYMAKIQDSNYYGARNEPLNFYTLIWENMKFSSTTLSTPPMLLRQAQQFYREVAKLHESIAISDISVPTGIKKLQAQIDIVEQQLIPTLEKNTAQIQHELAGSDIIL